jgi:hypothetical protein
MWENITRRKAVKSGIATVSGLTMTAGVVGSKKTDPSRRKRKINPSVSPGDARRTARKFVNTVANGPETPAGNPELFYAKTIQDDQRVYYPRAWVFSVKSRGRDVGYISIDAEQTESPVLSYGNSPAPQTELNAARKHVAAQGRTTNGMFLHHGGIDYSIETTDGNEFDLLGKRMKPSKPVKNPTALRPTQNRREGQ